MTTTVGVLKALFQLDTKEAEASAKKLEGVLGKELKGSLEGAAGGLGKLGGVLGALGPIGLGVGAVLGTVGTAVVGATKAFIEQSDQLDELSDRYGVSMSRLDAWGEAAKEAGVTAESLGAAAAKLSLNVQKGDEIFERMGLSLEELRKLSPEDLFEEVGARILELNTEAEQNEAAMAAMGKTGADALQALRGGLLENLPQWKAHAEAIKGSREQAAEMADKFTQVGQTWEKFKQSIAQDIGLPLLDKLAGFFESLRGGVPAAGDGKPLVIPNAPGFKLPGLPEGVTVDAGSMGRTLGPGKKDMAAEAKARLEFQKAEFDLAAKTREEEEKRIAAWAEADDDRLDALSKQQTIESERTEAWPDLIKGARTFNELIDTSVDISGRVETKTLAIKEGLQGLALLGGALGGGFGKALLVFENIGREVETITKNWGEMNKAQKIGAIGNAAGMLGGLLPGKAGTAVQGAGGGAATGAALGGFLGPGGAVAGGIIGGAIGFIGGLFGGGESKEEKAQREADALKTAEEGLAGLVARMNELQDASLQKGVAGVTAMIDYLGERAGATEEDFRRMGSYTLALFGSLRESGLTWAQAMEQVSPALDKLLERAEEAGVGLGALGELAGFRAFVQQNEELVAAAEGAGAAMDALMVTGNLTQETFQGLVGDVNTYIGDMEGLGLAHEQALAIAAPSLFAIQNAQENLGFTVDETTQQMIDQAEAAGLFENMKDPMEQMLEIQQEQLKIMAALAETFGATLPASVRAYIDELNRIPNVPIPGGVAPVTNDDGATGGEPRMARGGVVHRPTRAVIGEAGPEAVVPLQDFFQQLRGAGAQGGGDIHLYVDTERRTARYLSIEEQRRFQNTLNAGQITIPRAGVV